ncbi:hypothetical protein [Actinoplanes sp. DH11]|uniref:hypothetical protein n=1 Tax=Actinoplanes sp. DH11 TaxID=2857011 RepID=UPI001E428ACA|nr:hypothetical protein [Actinoplanes sp. DH11]
MGGAHRGEDPWAAWPSIPAVIRVMAGWFLCGIGALNLAVEVDGGLAGTYLVFHVVLLLGGVLLLARHRLAPSPAGSVITGLLTLAGMAITALPVTSRCCLDEHPQRRGYPFPFLGSGDGTHVDPKYLVADLIFWGCAGLLVLTVVTLVERMLPERRTPVDLGAYAGRHAERHALAATGDRSDENVGGLP